MAFGIKRSELQQWKASVAMGNIAFLTHYWIHPDFPECKTVTKVGCSDLQRLTEWGRFYGLRKEWIDLRPDYPHFDLFGEKQKEVLRNERLISHLERFHIR